MAFMEEIVKPKRRKSLDKDDEPVAFSISAFKDPVKKSSVASRPKLESFRPSLDFGEDLDLGIGGPPVPKLGPAPQPTRVEKMKLAEAERLKNKVLSKDGGVASSSSKPNPTHQDDVAMDYLYKTKTKSELNFLKRQVEKDVDTVEKKAKLSHKQNIEKYNSYLAAIPEQNELRRINWHKH